MAFRTRPTIATRAQAKKKPAMPASSVGRHLACSGCIQGGADDRPSAGGRRAHHLTCLPIRPAISNIETCGLPNTSFSFASALIMRLLAASCRLLALM